MSMHCSSFYCSGIRCLCTPRIRTCSNFMTSGVHIFARIGYLDTYMPTTPPMLKLLHGAYWKLIINHFEFLSKLFEHAWQGCIRSQISAHRQSFKLANIKMKFETETVQDAHRAIHTSGKNQPLAQVPSIWFKLQVVQEVIPSNRPHCNGICLSLGSPRHSHRIIIRSNEPSISPHV